MREVISHTLVNDGSTDATVEVAREHGVDHIVNLINNQGLAKAFIAGLDACVKLGADVIVNTDADNQYNAEDIVKLVEPILQGKADYVIGARPIEQIAHFSPLKKVLQNLGSRAVRIVSKTDVPDAPSGFRAVSRDGAIRLNVFNEYTYTLETIIQAGQKNMALCSVPVRVNKNLRPSRLIKNVFSYVNKSIVTIFRIFVTYKPFRFFMTIGLILFGAGVVLGLRYIYFVFTGSGRGHIQSVILCGALLAMGFQTMLIAFMADLLSVNRKLLEDLQYRIRKKETQQSKQD